MKKRYFNITMLALLMLPATAFSQKLTLDECVSAALDKSKVLALNSSAIEQNTLKLKEISSSKLPQLKLFAAYTRLSEIPNSEIRVPFSPNPITIQEPLFNNFQLRLNVTQPVFLGNRLTASEEATEKSIASLKTDQIVKRNEEAIKVINAWLNLAGAMEHLKVVNENITSLQKRLDDANRLLDNGMATRNDILKIEVQLSGVISQRIDAETAIRSAKGALNLAMGRSVDSPIEITDFSFEKETPTPGLTELLNEAKKNRAEFTSLAMKKEALASNLEAAKSGYYPEVFVSSNLYYANPNQRIFPVKDEFKATWDVSLNLQWSLWDWGNTSAKADQVTESMKSLGTTESMLGDAVANEVHNSWLALGSAKEKLKNLEITLTQAEENYRVTLENFKSQAATSTDLITADTMLFSAKSSIQVARIRMAMAYYNLMKSTGKQLY